MNKSGECSFSISRVCLLLGMRPKIPFSHLKLKHHAKCHVLANSHTKTQLNDSVNEYLLYMNLCHTGAQMFCKDFEKFTRFISIPTKMF